jgi:hypothetical protein
VYGRGGGEIDVSGLGMGRVDCWDKIDVKCFIYIIYDVFHGMDPPTGWVGCHC